MWKALVIFAAVLVMGTAAATPPVMADGGVDKGIVISNYIVVISAVEAIDQERRTIAIKSPDGKAVTLRASKKVKNFQEIKKGDVVTAEYLEAVAVIVRKPDGKSLPGYLKDVTIAPPGKESAALPVDMVESLGMVEAIDYGLRTVTVKGPDEAIQTYKVDTRVKKFKDISKGDKVYIKVTEPLAVRIRPVEK